MALSGMTAGIIEELQKLGNLDFKEGMKRFGINTENAFGIKIPVLKNYARKIKKNHALALNLWHSEIHEARLLAVFIADPKQITSEQMEQWVKDFNSWDICDQACSLFDKTSLAYKKAMEWTKREDEFQKRAGFSLMANLAIHDKKAENEKFLQFFPFIEKEAKDGRNFVKKAVNWSLRQIGKRNRILNLEAIKTAERIKLQDSKSAGWIATDALRELKNEKTREKLKSAAAGKEEIACFTSNG